MAIMEYKNCSSLKRFFTESILPHFQGETGFALVWEGDCLVSEHFYHVFVTYGSGALNLKPSSREVYDFGQRCLINV